MREVIFRGKSIMSIEELDELEIAHENGWIYGNLIMNKNNPYIVGDIADSGEEYIAHEYWVKVIPESVGQSTGYKKIFENDIVIHDEEDSHAPNYHHGKYGVELVDYDTERGYSQLGVVKFNAPSFTFEGIRNIEGDRVMTLIEDMPLDWLSGTLRVVGNMFDDKELLR